MVNSNSPEDCDTDARSDPFLSIRNLKPFAVSSDAVCGQFAADLFFKNFLPLRPQLLPEAQIRYAHRTDRNE